MNIPLLNSYFLAAIFFLIPVKVGPAYILSFLILLLSLIVGDLNAKRQQLKCNPLTWIFGLYFIIPVISLLWSEDLLWGIKMAKRSLFFLFFPLYALAARKEHAKLYALSFVTSISITVLLSYYNWFQLHYFPNFPEGIRSSREVWQIAPFLNSIMYNPILAFGSYVLGHIILFENLPKRWKLAGSFVLITFAINMFISGGRSGQVGFLLMAGVLVVQHFSRRPVVASLTSLVIIGGIVVVAYHGSPLFRERFDRAVYEVKNHEDVVNSSVGLRINYATNAFRMFVSSPILGVGVGDYPKEYSRINAIYSPDWGTDFNPHNQYLFALATTGLLGGVILLCVLFYPLYYSRQIHDEWSKIRIALPFLFAVICFGESYLWRSNTGLMFVVFSALLYSYSYENTSNERLVPPTDFTTAVIQTKFVDSSNDGHVNKSG